MGIRGVVVDEKEEWLGTAGNGLRRVEMRLGKGTYRQVRKGRKERKGKKVRNRIKGKEIE